MAKLISKISASLLAPVIFGAVCLSCLVQPMPVLAATAEMSVAEQNKACADYKDPGNSPAPIATVSVTAVASITQMDAVPYAQHAPSCRVAGDDSVFETKSTSVESMPVAVLPVKTVRVNTTESKNNVTDFYKTIPDKNDLITGCVFKLE